MTSKQERQAMACEMAEGARIGRDPRRMTVEEIHAAGHERMPLLKAIRTKCVDCCCGSESEVRKCTAVDCALWPYRMRHNPFHTRTSSDQERDKAAARLRTLREQAV
jgi:hypothetical protein